MLLELKCDCQDNQEEFLKRAFDRLRLDVAQQQLLVDPFREVIVQIPLNIREGTRETLKTFTGYRVQQTRPGSIQGRVTLPSRCQPGGDTRSGAIDDVEDGAGGYSFRGSQGRYLGRSKYVAGGSTGDHDEALHSEDGADTRRP